MLAFAMAWRNESELRLQGPSLCPGSSPG
jgi:hypothetical protein